jgi:hypothetical protein
MKYLFAFSLLAILLTGCKNGLRIGDILDGPGMVYTPPTNVELDEVQRKWHDTIIPVDAPKGEEPIIITLLTAFNRQYPTHAVDTVLTKVNEPDFEGAYFPDDDSGDAIQTLYARPYPFVQFYTGKEGAEHLNACTIQRDNGHTLLIINFFKNAQGDKGEFNFFSFLDYDPETSQLTPETEPWAKLSPVVKGNRLVPFFDLFEGIFAVGECKEGSDEPDYFHNFDFDGQNFTYMGHESNLPEDFE